MSNTSSAPVTKPRAYTRETIGRGPYLTVGKTREVVHVLRNTGGWWDVKTDDGVVIAQYTTEFQARESGRVNARRLHADLAIHQPPGPTIHWTYDEAADVMKPK